MGLYIILLLFMGIGLSWLILTRPAHKSAAMLTSGGPLVLIAIGCLLTLGRRGVIGMPLIFIGVSWWRRNHSRRPETSSGGQKSTVRSANLEMELDHDTGEIDGTVLTGRMKGRRLSLLKMEELQLLYREISSDADSLALLESFLDRRHPKWRESGDFDSFKEQDSCPAP